MEKFKNKYRTNSIRLKSWDYTNPWWYFVTVCTKNHKEYFGEIKNTKMVLNDIGRIAEKYWFEIPQHYEIVELDYFVIMPNHLHGIIIINETVETRHGVSLHENREFSKPIANSLSTIINHFKGAVTRECNKQRLSFQWQPRFYDRIIRNEKELFKIRKYIKQNPLKWEIDTNFPENIDL